MFFTIVAPLVTIHEVWEPQPLTTTFWTKTAHHMKE